MQKQRLNFDNQEAIWDEERGILFVHINEPFHSAGIMYGWEGCSEGVGINEKIIAFGVKEYATIVASIGINRIPLYIEAFKWRDFCLKHNSFYIKDTDKGKITLFVIQSSQLKPIRIRAESSQTLLLQQ